MFILEISLFAKYVKNKFSIPLSQSKMGVRTSLHSIDNTVEMLGLSVSSVWECKLNFGDVDAYFMYSMRHYRIALWDLVLYLSQKY